MDDLDRVAIALVLLISVVLWGRLLWVAMHETPTTDWRGERSETLTTCPSCGCLRPEGTFGHVCTQVSWQPGSTIIEPSGSGLDWATAPWRRSEQGEQPTPESRLP